MRWDHLIEIKPHPSENSRGLNCQFDICSCVSALISFFWKFRAFLNRKWPSISFQEFDYTFVWKVCFLKFGETIGYVRLVKKALILLINFYSWSCFFGISFDCILGELGRAMFRVLVIGSRTKIPIVRRKGPATPAYRTRNLPRPNLTVNLATSGQWLDIIGYRHSRKRSWLADYEFGCGKNWWSALDAFVLFAQITTQPTHQCRPSDDCWRWCPMVQSFRTYYL